MASYSTSIPSRNRFQFTYFRTLLFLYLFTIFYTASVSSKTPLISYTDHCGSIVPESAPTVQDYTEYNSLSPTTTYFTGGDRIIGKNSSYFEKYLSFYPSGSVYKTNTNGVYKFQGHLRLRSSNMDSFGRNSKYVYSQYPQGFLHRPGRLIFLLRGYYSENSGKICMVGSASWYSSEGNKYLKLDAVLKLNFPKNSTIFTSLVSGKLESLNSADHPSYFEPISILSFPLIGNYNYTVVSKEFDEGCSGVIDIPQNNSLSLQPKSICSMLSRPYDTYELKYASDCKSGKNCTIFGGAIGTGFLPRMMSLNAVQCSEDEQKLRYVVNFLNSSYVGYYQSFHPKTTLVGEGSWDANQNRLCIVACRILNLTDSMGNAQIGDCSIRLSLRYPSIHTIRNSLTITGQIWTTKTVNESGYFERIMFTSSDNSLANNFGLKYEFTETVRVKKSCPVKKPVKEKGERYPNLHSNDMRFDISVKASKKHFAWGYVVPISVGDHFYDGNLVEISNYSTPIYEQEEVGVSISPMNVSYKISFTPFPGLKFDSVFSSLNLSLNPNFGVEISAEGIYDDETGNLCMVGCRKLGSYIQNSTNDSVDCEILVNFQFPPLDSKKGSLIKGSIKSTRGKTDPLYFEHLNMSSTAFYTEMATQSIWRMDLEIIMVLISNTLACLFVAFQLVYVKKYPDVLPCISLVMLVILTLGSMIPLVLNFEALFLGNLNRRNILLGGGGWLEVNEVIVRLVTMVAFLLQFRLLQMAWSARMSYGKEKNLWIAERTSLLISLLLYILGGLIAVFVNWKKYKYSNVLVSSSLQEDFHSQYSILVEIRSYAGLVLDGFLLPQILVNIFRSSRENALSRSFYIGTTFVRLLPHGYDLYRAHNYVERHFEGSYIYANPSGDFYSTSWDVIIPCGGILLSVLIYLQQRFGGRCILPKRFRESAAASYEKVPVVGSE